MAEVETFDVVVLGGGPVGENVAQYAAAAPGLTVALVERELLGGECSYYACMPSKALLRPLQVAATAGALGGLSRPPLDVSALLARRDAWVAHYDDAGQVTWAEDAGLTVVRGHGRLAGERRVEVDGPAGRRVLAARRAVVLATGSGAVVPQSYADAHPWGSRDATGLVEVPSRVAVVGGGVVACEAATWLAGMGAEVTLLVRGDRLLPRLEEFAGTFVRDGLAAAGVAVQLSTEVTSCSREDARDTGLGRIHGGPVTLTTQSLADGPGAGGSTRTLVVDELLVAVGRRPRLADAGLDSLGLTADDVLSRRLPDWLHAVGDAAGEPALTHWGKYRARVLGGRLAAAGGAPAAYEPESSPPVPQVIFTDPEVAAVGMTEAEARGSGRDVVTARVPITAAAGVGLLRDDPRGAAQLVVDAGSGAVLGATFVGPEVADLVQAATVAIVGAVPVHVLRHAVPSYPTASELWLRLLDDLPVALRAAPR